MTRHVACHHSCKSNGFYGIEFWTTSDAIWEFESSLGLITVPSWVDDILSLGTSFLFVQSSHYT